MKPAAPAIRVDLSSQARLTDLIEELWRTYARLRFEGIDVNELPVRARIIIGDDSIPIKTLTLPPEPEEPTQ